MAVRNFLSFLSPGFSQASLPGPQTVGVPGLSRCRLGPLVRPKAERGVRVSPPPRPPLALRRAPNTHPNRGGGDPTGVAGPGLQSPASPPGLLGRLAFALFPLVFYID